MEEGAAGAAVDMRLTFIKARITAAFENVKGDRLIKAFADNDNL